MVLKAISLALASAVCVLSMVRFYQERSLGKKRCSWIWLIFSIFYYIVVVMRITEFGML